MPLSDNQLHYFISYAVAFLVFGFVAKWYFWPVIKDRAPKIALTPVLLYSRLRVMDPTYLVVAPGRQHRRLDGGG